MGSGENADITPAMRIRSLGALEVWLDDEQLDARMPAKAVLLLVYLADAAAPVARSVLAGLLWSDQTEERARSSLRVTLVRAKAVLGDIVTADRRTVRLAGPVSFDAAGIEAGDLAEISASYRGPFLEGLSVDNAELFEDWAAARRQALETKAMRALLGAAREAHSAAQWERCLELTEQMQRIEPWNEIAHRHVLTALAATNGKAAALAAHESFSSMLRAEFGVDPDPETIAAVAALRDGQVLDADRPASPAPDAAAMRCRVLGHVGVELDGVLHELGGPQQRSLLATLALRAPLPATERDLIGAIWGADAPKTAGRSLRRFIAEVRETLGPFGDRLESVPAGYRLNALRSEVDASAARALITLGNTAMRGDDPLQAVTHFRDALALWVGPSLGGITPTGDIARSVAALDEQRLGTVEALIEAELALGHHHDVAAQVEEFASQHPTRERAWGLLMLARYRCGRQTAAFEAFEQLRENLAREDVQPSATVEALYRQMLDHSPAVDEPTALETAAEPGPRWRVLDTAFAVPLPNALERAAARPMAGRSSTVGALLDTVEQTRSDGPRTVLIAGEPGIGKTRVAAEVASQAIRNGAAVLYGRADEDLAVPYQPWAEALAALADHVPPHIARRHVERFGDGIGLLMPNLGSARSAEAVSATLSPADTSQQQLLFEACVALFDEVADRRPLVVVLDDLQWADTSSLQLLRYVARRVSGAMAIVGLYRPTDIDTGEPVGDLLDTLVVDGTASLIALEGIDLDAAAELVVHDDDPDVATAVAAWALAESNGNPFYFNELVRSAVEQRTIDDPNPAATSGAAGGLDTPLPASIQRVVGQRVGRLGEAPAETLRVASVFGREFDLDVLAAALREDEAVVLDHLESALHAGLVNDAPAGRDRFAFCHDLVHHALADAMSSSRRARVHSDIATAIDGLFGDDLGARVGELATHLLAAADPAVASTTVERCREAARRAAQRLAPTEAIAWYESALAVLDAHLVDPRLEASLLVELGTQQRNAGDTTHRSTLIRAGSIAAEQDDPDTLVAAALANSRGMNSHVWEIDLERIALLRAALEAVGPEPSAARADLMASLANEQWSDDDRTEAEALYREAMSVAREVDDPDTLARVLIRVSRARNFRFEREEFAAVSAEVDQLSTRPEITDPLVVCNCLTTVLNTSLRLGLADEIDAVMKRIHDAEQELPLPMFTLAGHLSRGLAAGLRGDIEAYELEATATFEHAIEIGDEEAMFIFEGQLFYTRYLQGRTDELLELIGGIVAERPDVPLYRAVSAILHVESDLFDEARELIDAELVDGFEPSVDMFQIQALTIWANAAASVGHVDACERLYDALERHTNEMAGHLVQVTEPIDISLGRMCAALGRFDEAVVHFDRADEMANALRARWMKAQSTISRAEMVHRRGGPDDIEQARALAQTSLDEATDHGYGSIARRAQALISG